ncbi:MAG: hypothetical protein ChlgKO_01720 [Chlamydiales bacterium]
MPTLKSLPIAEAKKKYGSHFFSRNQEEGLFLYVPPRTVVDEPLEVLDSLTLVLGEGAEVKIYCKAPILDIVLEKGAQLKIEEHIHVEQGEQYHSQLHAKIYEEAQLLRHLFRTGGGIAHEEVKVELRGARADATLNGAANIGDRAQHNVNILAHHIAPRTTSHQYYKNILDREAKASFEAKIYVEKEALLTDAYQLVNHLLLSPKAAAFSRPNLEIFADDVKASHGATVSEVDKRYLHYLKTRGIDETLGKKMLLKGFLLTLFENTKLQTIVAESL